MGESNYSFGENEERNSDSKSEFDSSDGLEDYVASQEDSCGEEEEEEESDEESNSPKSVADMSLSPCHSEVSLPDDPQIWT